MTGFQRESGRSVVILLLGVLVSGCFTLQSVDRVVPDVGSEVALDLNDGGRVALAPTLGREVEQVHGHLLRRDSQEYVLAVTSVEFLHGGSQSWKGQRVSVPAEYTRVYYENRLSKPRTVVVTAIAIGGLAFAANRLLQTGGSGPDVPGPPPIEGKQRLPARVHVSIRSSDAIRLVRRVIPLVTRF